MNALGALAQIHGGFNTRSGFYFYNVPLLLLFSEIEILLVLLFNAIVDFDELLHALHGPAGFLMQVLAWPPWPHGSVTHGRLAVSYVRQTIHCSG
jgi:hypothetical protein